MTVTFFGHRDTSAIVEPILEKILKDLIVNDGANVFYVGNQGQFDYMVIRTLKKLKLNYPHIVCTIVLAYMPVKQDNYFFDTIFPEELENTPKRFAIDKRNTWLIEKSDVVVTYVVNCTGGAYKFKAIAERKGKRIINVAVKS